MQNKPIVYAKIPEFDQATQAVFQVAPVDMGDYIFIGIEVRDVPQDKVMPE
jgi:hypothetical protein